MRTDSRRLFWQSCFRPRAGHLARVPLWRHRVVVSVLAAPLFLAAPAHATQQYQQSVTFQTTHQSQWDTGSQYQGNWDNEYSVQWNQSASAGDFYDVDPGVQVCDPTGILGCATVSFDLGNFGAKASASTSGAIGAHPHVTVNGGTVNVSYPVQVTFQYPDDGVLYPGDPFTLVTSFVPTGGSLTTTSPHARVTCDAILHASISASADVQAFGSSISPFPISPVQMLTGSDPFGVDYLDNWTTIMDTDSSEFRAVLAAGSFAVSRATDGIVSGSFHDLANTVSGGLLQNSTMLQAANDDTFMTAKLDFSNAALAAAGLPGFETNINSSGIQAALQILDAFEQFDFKVGQTFQFKPTVQLSLQLSNGQTINLNAGQSTQQLTFPTVSAGASSDNLTVTPTYSMDGQLSNQTDFVITPSYNFAPFNLSFSGSLSLGSSPDIDVLGIDFGSFSLGNWTLPSFSVNPTGTFSYDPGDISTSLYSHTFALQGFNHPTAAPFTIVGYTYPTPTLTSVMPAAFKPGAATQLTAAGTSFVPVHTTSSPPLPSTTAQWNGTNEASQYVSSSQLTFNLTPTQANTEGIFPVTAANPAPGGGASNSQNVIIDGTAPVTTPSLTGPQNANNHGWYTNSVAINLSTNDTLSGVSQVNHGVDGASLSVLTNAPLGPGTFNTPGFTVSGEGPHTVTYSGTDNVGNVETTKSTAVNIDGTPPAIAGSRVTAANTYGWNNGPVTVHFSSSDATSGLFSTTPDTTLSGEGSNQSVTGTAVDNAGNSANTTVSGINIDLTAPAITYSGNASTYTPDQMITISCTCADPNLKDGTPGSGILSNTCQNITGPGYSFPLGVNSFSASATDKAGNTGSGQTSFTVQVTYDSICTLVHRFVTDPSVAASLCGQLSNAQAAGAQGQLKAKANILEAFVNLVQAQTGKSITPENAAVLTNLAQAL